MISKSTSAWMLLMMAVPMQGFTPLQTQTKQRFLVSLSMVSPPPPIKSLSRKPVALKHLFRHYDDISMDCWLRCHAPESFLRSCGYTQREIDTMAQEYPEILNKDVHDHLAPHMRFLVRALGGGTGDLMWASTEPFLSEEEDDECALANYEDNDGSDKHRLRVSPLAKQNVPVKSFFNLRLEKALAPWHAYMEWQKGVPSGKALLQDGVKLTEFLTVAQSGKLDHFVELCNAWDATGKHHTVEQVSEFTHAFHEGMVPAVRNHLHVNAKQVNCEPGQMTELLLSHGANHLEDDHHGASLLHWAAGTGNLRAVQALLREGQHDGIPAKEVIATDRVAKDGATVLHWAACGVSPLGTFGNGGHVDICRLLLDTAGKDLANQTTNSQSSALEWAAWAGSLDVVKLLIEEYDADPHFCSDNGNVAHWACAGGSLRVCQYLADTHGVNFCLPNMVKGWTPLNLASSEYHPDIAEWLVQRFFQTTSEDTGCNIESDCIQSEVAAALHNELMDTKTTNGAKQS
ncbi:Ankyrin Repeat [Seminavis robusta]|uniref:Ankyrin Repeat n=1 Tax=Seminavis robusta TaxID=568900 RepID=A0A9N8EFJ3_9STRA|nr:Ankyrin Repeat [Seminavis robusta]|eukprot:Sro1109_g242350.1 Ankyrin Repeat (516) ;mRNA; r:30243-31877